MKKNFLFIFILLSAHVQSQVTQNWVARYDAQLSSDVATCIDVCGNLYVAGTIHDSVQDLNWAILKYDTAGNLLWHFIYNGSSNKIDYINAITTDDSCKVYITGSVYTSNYENYATMKLDSSGNMVWVSTFNGSGSGTDIAHAIAVDTHRNVYVTGESKSPGNTDYVTIKYNSAGMQAWVATFPGGGNGYDCAYSLVLDDSDNVYITGQSYGSNSHAQALTIKYDSSGVALWTRVFNSGSGTNDFGKKIILTPYGLCIGGESTPFRSLSDILIISYSRGGSLQWSGVFDRAGYIDAFVDICMLGNNRVAIAGNSEITAGNYDMLLAVYDSLGTQEWVKYYEGAEGGNDLVTGLTTDAANNILITGSSLVSETRQEDIITLSFNANGIGNWRKLYDYSNTIEQAGAICIDAAGRIYVTGSSATDTSSYDFVTIRYTEENDSIKTLRNYFQMLATGLYEAGAYEDIRALLYSRVSKAVDRHFVDYLPSLLRSADSLGYGLTDIMNDAIREFYSLPPDSDYVNSILDLLVLNGSQIIPIISVPNYDSLSDKELGAQPQVAYQVYKDKGPYPSVASEKAFYNDVDIQSGASWLTGWVPIECPCVGEEFLLGEEVLPFPVQICNCTARQWGPSDINDPNYNGGFTCSYCPNPVPTVGPIGNGLGSGSFMQYEIQIIIGFQVGLDGCLKIDNLECDQLTPQTNYTILSSLQWTPYYTRDLSTSLQTIKKIPHPIEDRRNCMAGGIQQSVTGDLLTLCKQEDHLFNSFDENTGQYRYGLGHGGVYKIYRPGTDLPPLYFAFPYSDHLWYTGGPDMRLYFGYDFDSNTPECSINPWIANLAQNYETQGCNFCTQAPSALSNIFPDLATDPRIIIASTDETYMHDFWTQNIIVVGFHNGGMCDQDKVFKFDASQTQNPCTPTGTLLASLVLTSNEEYQIGNSGYSFPYGIPLTLHVVANFSSGQSYIDDCKTITLTGTTNIVNLITNIIGNIDGYDSGTVNYLVEVYQ